MINATRLTRLLAGAATAPKVCTFLCGRRTLPPHRSLDLHSHATFSMKDIEILAGTEDRYNGIQIDPDGLPTDPSEFTARLTESLLVCPTKGNCILSM